MELREPSHERETDPAAGAVRVGDRTLGEWLEDVRLQCIRNAGTVVVHAEDDRVVLPPGPHEDRRLAIERYPTLRLMWRAYELRDNVTAYDAHRVASTLR